MKYESPCAGQWVYPKKRGYRLACCDCGSVHRVNFKLVRDKRGAKILMQFFEDRGASAAMRRRPHKFAKKEKK